MSFFERLFARGAAAAASGPGAPAGDGLTRGADRPVPEGAAPPAGEGAGPRLRPAGPEPVSPGCEVEDILAALHDAPDDDAGAGAAAADLPVGWLVVTRGPGRGRSFALSAGASPIGRGADQRVRLDFGDGAIAPTRHAEVTYDAARRGFTLAAGDGADPVRLNGRPLTDPAALAGGDRIGLGQTELRLTALCGEGFDWSEPGGDGAARAPRVRPAPDPAPAAPGAPAGPRDGDRAIALPDPVRPGPEGRAALRGAARSLAALAGEGTPRAALPGRAAEVAARLAEALDEVDDPALAPLQAAFWTAADTAQLLRIEGGADAAGDAARLLVQMRDLLPPGPAGPAPAAA
ncbi:MAG: FHA domain-containing protein [Hasllibacter sp.]